MEMKRLRRAWRGTGNDHGVVVVWTAILMVVFLGMAAIAVDISRWYVEMARVQKTVDAAALAGVVYMPGSLAKGTASANEMVIANGYNTTAVVEQGDRPSRLRVTMTTTVNNAFAPVLGHPTTMITRTAVADFASPVAMGSPCNIFGNESMESGQAWSQGQFGSVDCAGTGEYWLNIAGKNTNKARGDGYASGYCTKSDDGKGIDNCANPASYGNLSGSNATNNADYDANGYTYIVRTKRAGLLDLEGFDIGWVATGDTCSDGYPINQGARPTNMYVSTQAEANARYATGRTNYCTGDSSMGNPEGDDSTVRTVVTVRGPGPDPWSPLEGPELCTLNLPGWGKTTPLTALSQPVGSGGDELLQRTFHRWADLCTSGPISVDANKDYSIQVKTIGGGGQNRFGLRASLSGGSNADVSIFASSKVSLYNNVPAGTAYFKALRLDGSAAGRTLVVRFFDLGDATDPVHATVMQPDNAKIGTTNLLPSDPFAGCIGAGPKNGDLAGCTVTTTASTNGGRWQEIAIKIPGNYTCTADADQSKCWVRIKLRTSSSQSDTTTWSARLDGDPVRLVE